MDAVLPLTARDVERSDLLLRSLERHVTGITTLFVIMPPGDISSFRAPQTERFALRVVSELDLVPEFAVFPGVGGWYRQQLVKLCACDWVQSEYYLTLDADVIATRSLSLDTLFVQDRTPCYIDPWDLHPDWYRAAEGLLGMALPRLGISHNVTPCIYNRRAMQELLHHLAGRWQRREFCGGWTGVKQWVAWLRCALRSGPAPRGFAALLAASPSWSEQSLYYSFLEATGQFGRYHYESPRALYDEERSVWFADGFADWDAAPLFAGEGPPYFVVVQSNTAIPVSDVRAKVDPWFGP